MTTSGTAISQAPDHVEDAMRAHYEAMADSGGGRYRSRFDPDILDRCPQTWQKFQQYFESVIGPTKPQHVLDLGCGTGLYHPVLAPMVGELVGLDNSPTMLAQARKVADRWSLNTELLTGDASKTGFPDNTFDLVLTYDVLHHVPDIGSVAEEIRRILKPGGRFVGAETTMWYPPLFLYNLLHREEWGLIRIRPGILARAFRNFAQVDIKPDRTRFFRHPWVIDRALHFFDRYILCGPFKRVGARYIIEAHTSPDDSSTIRYLHSNAESDLRRRSP